jgi:hypothetical protein
MDTGAGFPARALIGIVSFHNVLRAAAGGYSERQAL